jgi:hypothetical protein
MISEFNQLGRILILVEILITSMGFLFLLVDKIPWLGKLPGNIYIKKKSCFTFLSSISILLKIIFYILKK